MGTGRSDYPNQINNVSGFPYIFRGALDVEATEINEAMKIAAAEALAALAKEPVPAEVCSAYNVDSLEYGFDYIIPKPLDPRILTCITPAVAKAAMDTGVARKRIEDLDGYARELERRVKARTIAFGHSSLLTNKKMPVRAVAAERDGRLIRGGTACVLGGIRPSLGRVSVKGITSLMTLYTNCFCFFGKQGRRFV